ncbi:hypothetical protein BOX15_Mlig021842g1 [Macrostomum lignano]|uniref:FAD dependent oxidoreductase domain-containing protein n=1 Tax=Macrostomum lignano TaxID=282301 RepID=A0A267ERA0_9PLAT|nr:hypothetical protein BOX15_Mlig021842g1 [Macrostomum lignano]
MQQQLKVAIVGGGIIGTACGLRILETLPAAEVTIFTDQVTPNTTGDVAAGFWTPVYLSKTPTQLSDSWSEETYRYLQSIVESNPTPGENGVHYTPGYTVYRSENLPVISWSHIPIGFRPMTESEVSMFPPEIKGGYFYVSVMAEGRKLLPILMDKFKRLGGRLVTNRRLTSFDSLIGQGFARIVNCTGLGARDLCADEKMYPIRGQVHRVRAPWMNFWLMDSETSTYCLPNSDTVVLGGTSQKGNWSTEVSAVDKADILHRVTSLWPSLASAPIVQDAVGLRPGREQVRLEREIRPDCTIYHNYGHGGSGLTIFWGCAKETVRLLLEDIGSYSKQQNGERNGIKAAL